MKTIFALSLLLIGSCTATLLEHDNLTTTQHDNLTTVRLTLPQRCAHLSRKPDPTTWDEEKHEYPRNDAWERCMLVERND